MRASDVAPTYGEVEAMGFHWSGLSRVTVVALLLPLGAVAPAATAADGSSAGPTAARRAPAPALIGWGENPVARNDVPRRLERARIARLAAGLDHNVAVTRRGAVVAWGDNRHGQREVPARLGRVRVTRVAAGGSHSLAVTETGAVVAWGDNRKGQSDVPAELDGVRVVRVAAGLNHSLALTEGGNVVAWGANRWGQSDVPAALDGVRVIGIDAGAEHNLALTSGGTVVAWGGNAKGQSDVSAALDGVRVTRLAAGGRHNLALTEDDTVVAWGANHHGQSDVPAALDGVTVTQIAAGEEHSLALTGKGALVAWGSDRYGQNELPTVLRRARVTRAVAGYDHNLALAGYRGPDVQIKGNRRFDLSDWDSPSGRYAGNNFFRTKDRHPDLGGSWVADVWPEGQVVDVTHPFKVRVHNDTGIARTFRIRGGTAWVDSDRGRPHSDPSLVRYYDGDRDVTRALRSPGGLEVRIRPGDFRQFKMRVALTREWSLVMRTKAFLAATRVGHPRHTDRVRGSVLFID